MCRAENRDLLNERVAFGAATEGGPDAERDAEAAADDEPGQRQLDGGRETVEEIGADGMAGAGAFAEIALEHLADVVDKLNRQGLVEAHLMLDRRAHLGGRVGSRLD